MNEIAQINVPELRSLASNMVAFGERVLAVLDTLPANSNVLMAMNIAPAKISQPQQLALIAKLVAERREVSFAALFSPQRTEALAHARQECFWLARRLTSATFVTTAKFFKRDHGTAMFGCKAVDERREVMPPYAAELDGLAAELSLQFVMGVDLSAATVAKALADRKSA